MEITDKELTIIKEIANNHRPNQRGIAKNTGLSLGLVNLIIKRLIKQGYVKTKHLNQKKLQYLLTPKGFSEKAAKSYKFTLKTINHLKAIREQIQELIAEQYQKGVREFTVSGDSDLADITALAINNLAKRDLKYNYKKVSGDKNKTTILTTQLGKNGNKSQVDLISYISEKGLFYW